MTAFNRVVIDTNVLVALVDQQDKWHASSDALREALKIKNVLLVYFDPVINEAFSVLAKRAQEVVDCAASKSLRALIKTLTRLNG